MKDFKYNYAATLLCLTTDMISWSVPGKFRISLFTDTTSVLSTVWAIIYPGKKEYYDQDCSISERDTLKEIKSTGYHNGLYRKILVFAGLHMYTENIEKEKPISDE